MSQGIVRPGLPKRFYAEAAVVGAETSFTVELDGRPLRTPLRRPMAVPLRAIAEMMAEEWRSQKERIDPSTMPATRLVNTAVDGIADNPRATSADLAAYIETDLLFYRAGYPESLVARQRALWDPIVGDAEKRLGVRFFLTEGVIHVAQTPDAIAAFNAELAAFRDPLLLAALHQMTTLTGSALIAVGVADGSLDVDAAWAAAHLDEDWNIRLWGADAEAEARRASRLADMRAAATIAGLMAEHGI